MMRTKPQNQSKFMRIITTPLKFLCKARDLYVNSLTNCATSVSRGHSMALPAGGQFTYSLPRSFSAASSRSNEDSEDYRELLRAASVRNFGHTNEIDMYLHQMRRASSLVAPNSKLPRSSSVGMGLMGRIDEDKPCDHFEEKAGDDHGPVIIKPSQLYPRSKSYAVAKRSGAVI